MDYTPKISVVTVCYNAKDVLEDTIKSVLCQTFDDYEYLIIDGGSNDCSLDIIQRYAGNPHVRWISEPDKGIYDAMNKGVKMAKGEWLNFMNAGDCFASNDVLENIFKEDYAENVKFLYSDHYIKDSSGDLTIARHDHAKRKINHQSSIYRRTLHDEFGMYVVTPRIIVSDLLFFMAIPKEFFMKVDTIISVNEKGGVSYGDWCLQQDVCLRVVYREYSFVEMLLHYISAKIKKTLHII